MPVGKSDAIAPDPNQGCLRFQVCHTMKQATTFVARSTTQAKKLDFQITALDF
ncbi:hypothetical protein [Ruegeria sp. EL01]|jgi:hypothetical protein|uniref:hypothetical protein n=1 Tax=Ruegeria sp. EL01 TaxID=2107578 RepID=UPI001C1F5A43|nr:hypothetical protein [Ruegeria sp. EL01]